MGHQVPVDHIAVAFDRMMGGLPDDRRACHDSACTRIPHEGDHFDATTERRWHNHTQNYGPR